MQLGVDKPEIRSTSKHIALYNNFITSKYWN